MSEFATKLISGFDTAVLTHENESNRSMGVASRFTETPHKGGLFLISKDATELTQRNNKGEQRAVQKRCNRKTVTHNEIFEYRGKSYRVNAAKSGLYVQMLRPLINQFEIAVQKWKRVFVLRFDLHQHFYSGDNKRVTTFIKRLFNRLKREYGFTEIGYCWVRERERAKAQHYHFVLFLNGRLIKHSKRINDLIKQAWEDPTGSYHVPTIKRPFYFGTSEEITDEVIHRVSYLAKARGKGHRDKQAKDFQCSRMKRD